MCPIGRLFPLFTIFSVIQGQTCQYDRECNEGLFECGFCVIGYCEFPFKTIFIPGKNCNFNKTHCIDKRDSVQEGLHVKYPRFEGYGRCVYHCSRGYYGDSCENEGSSNITYTSGVQLIAPTVVECMKDYYIFLSIQEQGLDDKKIPLKFSVLFKTDTGIFGSLSTEPKLKRTTTKEAVEFCYKNIWDPRICQFFKFNSDNGRNMLFAVPLKLPFWYPRNWTWDREREVSETGLTHNLMVKIVHENESLSLETRIFDPEQLLWTEKYPYQQKIVVDYSKVRKEAAAIPQIYNCGSDILSPVIYKEEEVIDLKSMMLYAVEDKVNHTVTLKEKFNVLLIEWEATKVEYTKSPQSYHYHIGGISWKSSSFSWSRGLYIVRLSARYVDLVRTDNFGQCYLRVKLKPLVARLTGGTLKTVNIEEDLFLDPTFSRDPNQPLQKRKLRFTMSCNDTTEAFCWPVYKDSVYYGGGLPKPPFRYSHKDYQFKANKVYKFTLKVELRDTDYTLEPAYDEQLVIFKRFPENLTLKSLEIICHYNCGEYVNPQDLFYLKLHGPWGMFSSLTASDFKWHFDRVDSNTHFPIQTAFQDEHHPNLFMVPENDTFMLPNTYLPNMYYEVGVTYKDTDIYALYTFETPKEPLAVCISEPSVGDRLQTFFKISCVSDRFVDRYEFYDKDFDNSLYGNFYGGRMIASQKTGQLDEVILSHSNFEIHTVGKDGIRSVDFAGKLRDQHSFPTRATPEVSKHWAYMNELYSASNIDELHRNSPILEFWNPAENSRGLLRMLTWLNMAQIQTNSDAKLLTSTLHEILQIVNLKFLAQFGLKEAFQTAVTLATITNTLFQESYRGNAHDLTYQDSRLLFGYLVDCISILLEVGRVGKQVKLTRMVFFIQVELMHNNLVNSVRRIGMILMSNFLPHQEPVLLKANVNKSRKIPIHDIIVYSEVKFPLGEMFPPLWEHFDVKEDIGPGPLTIPEQLHEKWIKFGYYIGLQITAFRQFQSLKWWSVDIYTVILHVQICYREQIDNFCSFPVWLESPIWVSFYVADIIHKLEFQGADVTRQSENLPEDVLDFQMKFFKIDLPPRSCLSVYFELEHENDELIVLVRKTSKPGYRLVMIEGKVVTRKDYHIDVVCQMSDESEFYYMAVVAGERVSLNYTQRFQYKMVSRNCISWDGKARVWRSQGSSVVDDHFDTEYKLTCEWSRLSFFAGEVKLAPAMVDIVQVIDLVFTPWNNTIIVLKWFAAFAAISVLIFILALWIDRHQHSKRFVTVLADNFPHDKHGYLICVKTGMRLNAGLKHANLGIRILGSLGESRAHVLQNDKGDAMGWFSEDWFLLFTNRYLGKVESIHIWLNSNIKTPAWFCDSIMVYDMRFDDYYTFVVNEWLTLSVTKLPEVIVKPLEWGGDTPRCMLFGNHIKTGMRLSHLWIATMLRHPRDPITRIDRLMAIICFILVSLVTSLCLVIVTEGEPYLESKEDKPSYSLAWIDVLISFLAFFVSTVVARLVIFMVRKCYHVWYRLQTEENPMLSYLPGKMSHYEQLGKDLVYTHSINLFNRVTGGTTRTTGTSTILQGRFSGLHEHLALQLMEHPLIPVQRLGGKSAVDLNWNWRCRVMFVSFFIVAISSGLVVVLSKKLSPIRIKRWLVIFGLATFFHAVIYLPLLIIFISLILTFIFDQVVYRDFNIFDPTNCQNLHLYGDPKYLSNIIRLRMRPDYRPIMESKHEIHRKKRLRLMKWRKILEFLLVFVFLIILDQFLNNQNHELFVSNAHLQTMVVKSPSRSYPDYDNIFNMTDFDIYIQRPFSFSFTKLWYNQDVLTEVGVESDRCFDNVHIELGRPHFRQFRVKPDYCLIPEVMRDKREGVPGCAAPLTYMSEDKQLYKPYWILPGQLNNFHWKKKYNHSFTSDHFTANWFLMSNWSYTDELDYTYFGKSGNRYPPGGYKKSLDRKFWVLLSVQDEWWVDHHTRAVLSQVTLYNVNTQILSEITLITEQTIAGQFIAAFYIQPLPTDIQINIWVLLLLLFTIIQFFKISIVMNSIGVFVYFMKGYRIYAFSVLILLIFGMMNLITNYFTAVQFDDVDIKTGSQNEFYKKSYNLMYARGTLTLVFILAVINIYISHFWRLGAHSYYYFKAVMHSFKYVTSLAIILKLFFLICCTRICYLISTSVVVNLQPNINCKFPFYKITEKSNSMGYVILRNFICLSSFVTTSLIVAVYAYDFKIIKKEVINENYSVNLGRFFLRELGNLVLSEDMERPRKLDQFSPDDDNHPLKLFHYFSYQKNKSLSENLKRIIHSHSFKKSETPSVTFKFPSTQNIDGVSRES